MKSTATRACGCYLDPVLQFARALPTVTLVPVWRAEVGRLVRGQAALPSEPER